MLPPGPSQDCTCGPSPPFCSAATSPLMSLYWVFSRTALISAGMAADCSEPRTPESEPPKPRLLNKPMEMPLSHNETTPPRRLNRRQGSLVEPCRPHQRYGPNDRFVQAYLCSRSAGTLPPFSASFCITCACSQTFIAAELLVSPV